MGITTCINPKEKWGSTHMCRAKKTITYQCHPTPTIDNLISVNGEAVFSKLDLRSGYHQITLARYITTFTIHKGFGGTADKILA